MATDFNDGSPTAVTLADGRKAQFTMSYTGDVPDNQLGKLHVDILGGKNGLPSDSFEMTGDGKGVESITSRGATNMTDKNIGTVLADGALKDALNKSLGDSYLPGTLQKDGFDLAGIDEQPKFTGHELDVNRANAKLPPVNPMIKVGPAAPRKPASRQAYKP